jgi:hypothetical protein
LIIGYNNQVCLDLRTCDCGDAVALQRVRDADAAAAAGD